MLRIAVVSLVVVLCGCRPEAAFTCQDDEACELDGEPGRCTALAHCAYPDVACADGYRYPFGAPAEIAGQCARVPGSSGESSGGSTVGSSGAT